jgi:hypothetical protein
MLRDVRPVVTSRLLALARLPKVCHTQSRYDQDVLFDDSLTSDR